jgi:hypothetical protein
MVGWNSHDRYRPIFCSMDYAPFKSNKNQLVSEFLIALLVIKQAIFFYFFWFS